MYLSSLSFAAPAPRFGAVYLSTLSQPLDLNRKIKLELTDRDAFSPEAQLLSGRAADEAASGPVSIEVEMNQCYDGQYQANGKSWYPEVRILGASGPESEESSTLLPGNIPQMLHSLKQLVRRATPVATMGMVSPEAIVQAVNGFLDYRIWQLEKQQQVARQSLDESRQQLRAAESRYSAIGEDLSQLTQAKGAQY